MIKKYPEIIIISAAVILCIIFRSLFSVCVILSVCIAVMTAERIFSRLKLKKKLTSLTDYISAVQDDLSLPPLNDSAEGETAVLQSEIYKVVAILREQYSSEKKQKQYMADMLADISHQLKTPLTAIQLMAELLEQPELNDENRLEYAEKIDSQLTRINWLIRSLLTLSQLEAGVLKMKKENIQLSELADNITDTFSIMAELRGVTLNADIPNDISVCGDRHWLAEALMNIVKNCIEHTSEGGNVRISAEYNNIGTIITIRDTGSGISENDLPHIFERFYKAENASVQSIGIGLALAKQIISCHNGKITAESKLGEGSSFTIKIYRM